MDMDLVACFEDGAICFKTDDTVNVNTAVASGKGKFAVEIWSDQ